MRKILSPAKGHGETIHIDGGDGKSLCGWSYVSAETFDGHPIYRGTVVARASTCARCRFKLVERVEQWTRKATSEQMEMVALSLGLIK